MLLDVNLLLYAVDASGLATAWRSSRPRCCSIVR